MTWTVGTYVVYLLVTVPLTIWVATTLSRNGRVFLADVFAGDDGLADAVNRLLVVGFYLLNLGFVGALPADRRPGRGPRRAVRDAQREGRRRDADARRPALLQRLRLQRDPSAQPAGEPPQRTRRAAGLRADPLRRTRDDRATALTVLTDPGCPLCRRFADWLARQPLLVPLALVPAGSPEARRLFPTLDHDATLARHRPSSATTGPSGPTSTPG